MLPFPIKPMLLQTAKKPFDSKEHIFEWKVDGIRCIMHFNNGEIRLQSKTGRDCTKSFPELQKPPTDAKEAIFDGEITVFTNKPDFESVMARYHANSQNIAKFTVTKPAVYIVWDILWLNGKKLINLPLYSRKELLDNVLENSSAIKKIDWLDNDGITLWEIIKVQGLEGIVAKKKNSKYQFKRSLDWLKIKNYQEAVVNVIGYSKKDGAVLVGTEQIVQGHAIGIPQAERKVLWHLLDNYGEDKGNIIYLPPGIRGIVKFTNWTPKKNMRDCSWVRFKV